MSSAAELERRWPDWPWREPLHVSRPDGAEGWACRICVALHGLRGRDVGKLPSSPAAVLEHIDREHPAGG